MHAIACSRDSNIEELTGRSDLKTTMKTELQSGRVPTNSV